MHKMLGLLNFATLYRPYLVLMCQLGMVLNFQRGVSLGRRWVLTMKPESNETEHW
jgi:hypothetical protein